MRSSSLQMRLDSRTRRVDIVLIACLFGVQLAFAPAALGQPPVKPLKPQELQFFEAKIRPVLVEKCYGCHSVDANMAEGGLRLDSRQAIRQGGSGGPALVPGDPNRSLLLRAVEHKDPKIAMPPEGEGEKLTAAQVKDFARWIKMGAPDPREDAEHLLATESHNAIAKQWWSYQPISNPVVPPAAAWAWNDIDRFIHEAQASRGIQPVADANPESLLRRLYFDLIGLPPTPAELQQFLTLLESNPRQLAIEQVVDRLLVSDQFGMHWGRHWLDVARYAESSGRDVNLPYNQAWRYRDWVIQSMQRNKPFDLFLKEQIAGDLLPADDDAQRAEQTVATGFLAVGSRSINENNPKQFAVDQADEQIDALFQATMATTLACARCHDHKFDPISQRQYTAVAGIFLSTDTLFGATGGNNARNTADSIALPSTCGLPTLTPPWNDAEITKKRDELQRLRTQITVILDEQEEQKKKKAKANGNFDRSKQQELRKLSVQANELEYQLSAVDEEGQPRVLAMGVADRPVSPDTREDARGRLSKYLGAQRRVAFPKIDDSPFFARGDIGMPGEKVPRGVPNLFDDASTYEVPSHTSGRLQLAEWITSPNNPLTPRVAVNRVWHWLIGQGIVDTVDNFGTTGSKPSHPELLDHLARRFVEEGWDMKRLIRSIVTSRTYQLASTVPNEAAKTLDPENKLCWRGKSRRLQAEEIRDAMLLVAGRLRTEPQIGTTMAKHFVGAKVDIGLGKKRSKGEVVTDDVCRSVYLPLPRNTPPEMLELFDLPDGTVVQGVRESTNVPSQSLYLLNNQTVAGHAGAVVKQMMSEIPGRGAENFEARLEHLYRSTLARSPTGDELLLANELFKQSETSEVGWVSLVRGLMATAEFRYLD